MTAPSESKQSRSLVFDGPHLLPADGPEGIRAVRGTQVVSPESCAAYLERTFGGALEPARDAMESLARAYKPTELALEAFGLYEKFRPKVPDGVKGWGAKGVLDLERVRRLAARG